MMFNATFNTFLWIDLQSKVYKLFSLSTLFLIFIISCILYGSALFILFMTFGLLAP